ncbi:GlxA family transcriptional regulator [Dactylosporangium siamense]|uniref:AraC family transcriptional regulator n=1 Tax=Dactylosporangium siamense TaxID=685454 RepID=A0A919PKA9_9ACTN|nr:helix-turn-helix domain-containing protein [Dactylosporangium siamense]GIG45524.1 AraC family transcriptional regulator [Dactylosporangium siamense]
MSHHPFRKVAVYLHEGTGAFGAGIVSEIFGYDRTARGLPGFDFAACTDRPGPVVTDGGLRLLVEHGLDRLAEADLVLVTSWEHFDVEPSPEALAAIRTAYERGATIAGHCTGTYVLAAAGLLDGLRATTHWRWADAFAARFPEVKLVPEVLYVDEGRIVTGAGAAAGVDMCLHLLRREYGAAVANGIARDMVVPPHRDGGQAQYVAAPVPVDCDDERLAEVLGWAREHLHLPLTVEVLAGRALMSQRSFARRFAAATGSTPHAWVLSQRLHRAEELLETVDLPIEEVARQVGFGTAATLREQFVRRRGIPPRAYRRTFAT